MYDIMSISELLSIFLNPYKFQSSVITVYKQINQSNV